MSRTKNIQFRGLGRLRPWQIWTAGLLGVAAVVCVLAVAALLAVALIGLAVVVVASAALTMGLRRLLGHTASSVPAPMVNGQTNRPYSEPVLIQEVRQVEMEVLEPLDERRESRG